MTIYTLRIFEGSPPNPVSQSSYSTLDAVKTAFNAAVSKYNSNYTIKVTGDNNTSIYYGNGTNSNYNPDADTANQIQTGNQGLGGAYNQGDGTTQGQNQGGTIIGNGASEADNYSVIAQLADQSQVIFSSNYVSFSDAKAKFDELVAFYSNKYIIDMWLNGQLQNEQTGTSTTFDNSAQNPRTGTDYPVSNGPKAQVGTSVTPHTNWWLIGGVAIVIIIAAIGGIFLYYKLGKK